LFASSTAFHDGTVFQNITSLVIGSRGKMTHRRDRGEGTVYPQRDKWIAQLTLPNGKRRSKSCESKKEALNWLSAEKSKINQGLFVADNRLRIGDFLASYMSGVAEHTLRPTTLQAHYSLINNHIVPELGNIRLSDLQPNQVQAFYAQKLDEGLSKRTVQYLHAILHKALNQALRWGLVVRNVTDLVDVPSPERRSPHVWTVAEVQTFLLAVSDHRWYPIYVIAIYCGLRKGEILGLSKSDVDLSRGVIRVRHQVTQVQGVGSVISEPKTEKAKRQVTISEFPIQVLRDHLNSLKDNQSLLFATSSGKPLSSRNVVRHFKSVIESTGLPDIRFHDLRHTHATLLLSAGTHPKVVQERLGHSQISLTLSTYSHVMPGIQEKAADDFQRIMDN
jgi:integrase